MKGSDAVVTIQLAVSSLAASVAFYGGILELPIRQVVTAEGAPEHFTISTDGMEIVFVEDAAVVREHPALEERLSLFPKGIGMTIHVRVSNIEEISDAIMEEGLPIFYPLSKHPFGIKELWCHDPDGYLVVVEEPVTF